MSNEDKIFNIRMSNLHGAKEEWDSSNIIPKCGEFVIYDDSQTPQIKIGDGDRAPKELPFFEPIYSNSEPLLSDVGGIKAAEHKNGFSNVPITDLITELLYPYTKPVISSFSLSPAAGVKEKNVTFTVTSASAKITKKSKPISEVALYRGSNKIATSNAPISTNTTVTFSGLSQVVNGSTDETFSVKVSEENGTANVVSQDAKYTFVYPYYFGVIDVGDINNISDSFVQSLVDNNRLTKLVEAKGTKSYAYTTTANQCAVIAYPASYGNLSKITDANNFTQTWTKRAVTINGVSYYVYVSSNAAATNFKYTFSY